MMKDSVLKVATKENLSYEEMRQSMDEIMSGQATQVQVA